MKIRDNHGLLKEGVIIRAYYPLGLYPENALRHSDGSLVISEDLIFSSVRFGEVNLEGYYAEREWLTREEIKLLAAIVLSVPDDCGKVYAYPGPMGYKIYDEGYDLSEQDLLKKLKQALREKISDRNKRFWVTVPEPPVFGGPSYEFNENVSNVDHQLYLYKAIDLEDHLLIRGLGALLKGDLLNCHHIFHTEACISLHIAMEGTLQIILRRLRNTMQNPSNQDASKYLGQAFHARQIPEKYFEDYYRDRIVAIHPSNRIGTFPDAPLAADDFYDLFEQLVAVYGFLITGNARDKY